MTKFKNKYRVESTRFKGWDYSTPSWYFVTLNTKFGRKYFGEVAGGKVLLSIVGKIAESEWLNTKLIRKGVDLDSYVIMPNHIHGIIIINGADIVDMHGVRLPQKNDKENKMQTNTVTALPDSTVKNARNNGISIVNSISDIGESNIDNSDGEECRVVRNCLSDIIKGYKSAVTHLARESGHTDFKWLPRFYDRIIRDQNELNNIRRYIEMNPLKWDLEKNNIIE